jgi:hypothetical protein
MRHARLALSVCLTLSCGCACMIAGAGKDLGRVGSKEEMHALLGEPVARGVAGGEQYEEFRTRRVIANSQWDCEGYCILCATTCCAPDLVCVPYQLGLLAKRTVLGQTIRVTYDPDGGVGWVERDGESVTWPFRRRPRPESQQGGEPPATAGVDITPRGPGPGTPSPGPRARPGSQADYPPP